MKTVEINSIQIDTGKQILISKWCVKCYPQKEWALFTYKGNSLCEKHFKLGVSKKVAPSK